MNILLDYLRLTLFLGGAFVGVQIPSFVDLYGQRLESHFLESKTSIEAFQLDAEKYFNGDMAQLIRHYSDNPDPVINDGGESIASLHSRAQFLTTSWSEFNSNTRSRYWHTFTSPVTSIRKEAWANYDFSIRLDFNGITWALGIGLALSLLIELSLNLLRLLFFVRKATPTERHEPPSFKINAEP